MWPDQFFHFADRLPEGMLLVEPDGTILAANRSVEEQVGISADELTRKRLGDIVAEPTDTVNAYLGSCVQADEMIEVSLVLMRSDGLPRACRCEATCVCHATESNPSLVLLRLLPK